MTAETRGWRRLLWVLALLVLAATCADEGNRRQPKPTSLEQAFTSAHPGLLPPGLRRLDVGERAIAARIRARLAGNVTLLLPAYLPRGYGLATPFISVGSGNVLPNPQVWRGGYRVSYTDGHGLMTVMVGEQRLPGSGPWRRLGVRWRGRGVAVRQAGDLLVVAALGAGQRVTVSGLGVPETVAARVLQSLRAAR